MGYHTDIKTVRNLLWKASIFAENDLDREVIDLLKYRYNCVVLNLTIESLEEWFEKGQSEAWDLSEKFDELRKIFVKNVWCNMREQRNLLCDLGLDEDFEEQQRDCREEALWL